MLVRITEKCDMGCNHCMINAGPNGQHMDKAVYEQTLKFIKSLSFPFIMMTGGEPFQHPSIVEYLEMAQKQKIKIIVLSNGTFVDDEELREKIIKMGIPVQITNDPRYYPRKITIWDHDKFYYIDSILGVSPFHRAVRNNIEITRLSPLCFNFRSFCRNPNIKDFKKAIHALRLQKKMCTPSINIDGSIAAGESNACSIFGTIYDSNLALTNNLCELKCGNCGLYKDMPLEYLNAIGEGK